ncbi:hypothetical protein ABPG75_002906 [Micractinium tetrahymenae]
MSQTNAEGGQAPQGPQSRFSEEEAKRLVAEATGGSDVREYGGDAIGGAGGGQPSNLAGGEIVGAPTGLASGAQRIMHSGGTLCGGDMGQHGMDSGPIQRPDRDPAAGGS